MCDLQIRTNKYDGSHSFGDYPFELSDFQKHSLEAIHNGSDTLVCAPTGSGKTLVAEASILKFYKETLRYVVIISKLII